MSDKLGAKQVKGARMGRGTCFWSLGNLCKICGLDQGWVMNLRKSSDKRQWKMLTPDKSGINWRMWERVRRRGCFWLWVVNDEQMKRHVMMSLCNVKITVCTTTCYFNLVNITSSYRKHSREGSWVLRYWQSETLWSIVDGNWVTPPAAFLPSF